MSKFKHTVLIVDDTKELSTLMGKVLEKNGIDLIYCERAESGLEELNKSETLFSLIISDETVQGRSGVKFLEHAEKINPSAIRILLCDCSDSDGLVKAINSGVVQKVIAKPWVAKDLIAVMKQSFLSFRNNFENERHVKAAGEKIKKIHKFDVNLKARAAHHKKKIKAMDEIIAKMKAEAADHSEKDTVEKSVAYDFLEESFEAGDYLEENKLEALLKVSLQDLFKRVENAAKENGIESLTIN